MMGGREKEEDLEKKRLAYETLMAAREERWTA